MKFSVPAISWQLWKLQSQDTDLDIKVIISLNNELAVFICCMCRIEALLQARLEPTSLTMTYYGLMHLY